MQQLDQCSACPGCAEPLEEDDRFCGRCGLSLATVPRPTAETASTAATATARPPQAGVAGPGAPAPPPQSGAPTHQGTPPEPGTPPMAVPPPPAHPPTPAGPPPSTPPPAAVPAPASGPPASAAEPTPTLTGFPLAPPAARESPRDPRTDAPAPAPPQSPPPPPRSASACAVCGTVGSGGDDADGYCEHCGHASPKERDHLEQEMPGVAAVSDRGLRHRRNEDAFTLSVAHLPNAAPAVLAVVCDGVSSSSRPDEASATAAAAARDALVAALPRGVHPPHAVHEALGAAARAVAALADPGRDRGSNAPACTIVGSVVAGEMFTVGWIGDSRAYWVPEDRAAPPARLTEDDSWAAQMVAAGLMTEADAFADPRAHAITGWLGADSEDFDPHTASFMPGEPGVVLVCTDGLWNYAESAADMAKAVPADARQHPLPAAQHLVRHALESGGHDNVTVAVLPFPAAPGRAGSV
ncbi:serine/threonine-protein phosphatase [Streptomyces sp. JJ66]|uniref:PP2C family protein-serine/threonine phosphatase n=1 Tax=Streptomyces sp. JJ66 TaxID=2803843 RepID=UPI001C573A96|nr:PP2C family serine/threonine-protein phosphatase [Streptomyces sp. JJ66]MBW1601142.1 serine/threonine-protein phosphatase [Streptomyces sp. JJ66]